MNRLKQHNMYNLQFFTREKMNYIHIYGSYIALARILKKNRIVLFPCSKISAGSKRDILNVKYMFKYNIKQIYVIWKVYEFTNTSQINIENRSIDKRVRKVLFPIRFVFFSMFLIMKWALNRTPQKIKVENYEHVIYYRLNHTINNHIMFRMCIPVWVNLMASVNRVLSHCDITRICWIFS